MATSTMWKSLTIIREEAMGKTKQPWTVHPGEILKTEFMDPMKISSYRLAKDLDFPGIYDVLRCKRSISAETALRLGKYFGLPAQFWMNLQAEHDLRIAAITAKLDKVKTRTAA
jgi:antitoxin HigA-1